ncbi:MAG TPA: hypothetical protein DHW07_00715 [Gammaproteobacteria bacterium]|nr:hypothetical protein [Gammaproteobacteria bacterium]
MTALHRGRRNVPAKDGRQHPYWKIAVGVTFVMLGDLGNWPVAADQPPESFSVVAQPYGGTVPQSFSPVLDLDFETLAGDARTLKLPPDEGHDQKRPGAVDFRLELGEDLLVNLRDQHLDELGLYLLDVLPPRPNVAATERQRQRWHLLERQRRTDQLQDELQAAFVGAQGDLRLELGLRLGDLLLRTGNPERARAVFQQLLAQDIPRAGAVQQLRQRIVLSYFDEGRFYDAADLAEHLTSDFGSDQPSWLLLRALIALSQARPDEALALLSEEVSVEAGLWRVFAGWKAKELSATAALVAIGKIKVPADTGEILALRSAMIALIAESPEHARTRAGALESLVQKPSALPELLKIDTKLELLATYAEIARMTLAQEGISLDELEAVWNYLGKKGSGYALSQRALGMSLLLQEKATGKPLSADSWLIRHLIETGVPGLIPVFFGDEGIAAEIETVSQTSLMLLVDEALRREDLPSAARLQARIAAPVPGIDPDTWAVRTARIHVLGGNVELGAQQLGDWLSSLEGLSPASIDRAMQIMFDLQFIGEHRLALDLFQLIAPLARTPGHRRELFYWSGQSWVGLKDYGRGAAFFLESARLSGEQHPFWRKSALYQAAQALESAALYGDAAKVYKELLGGSREPKMQARLRYRLAQIEQRRTQGNLE